MNMWGYVTPGIPDGMFGRSPNVPITKEEVRTIQISKARIRRGDIIYDIGCGSGSITVEAALQTGRTGRIIAIDNNPEAASLTRANTEKFGISNVEVICGDAQEHVRGLPAADAAFIGGTGGATTEIIRQAASRLRDGGRIVVGVILVETLYSVLRALEDPSFEDVDVTQVTVSKSRKTSTGTMMLARNPVTIVSATCSRHAGISP